MNNAGTTTYHAKQKEVAGDGTALANTLLPVGSPPLPALPQVPAVGALIAPLINTHILTHPLILETIQFYNYDFGIRQTDTVPYYVFLIVQIVGILTHGQALSTTTGSDQLLMAPTPAAPVSVASIQDTWSQRPRVR
ncbi:hypothetical protein F5887DRAFT_921618 [Amanita rubescens]|nr:hypothetical protein F5887DRAFT_921618 [Amanita rubescens]